MFGLWLLAGPARTGTSGSSPAWGALAARRSVPAGDERSGWGGLIAAAYGSNTIRRLRNSRERNLETQQEALTTRTGGRDFYGRR
jgi:hypothetical protein